MLASRDKVLLKSLDSERKLTRRIPMFKIVTKHKFPLTSVSSDGIHVHLFVCDVSNASFFIQCVSEIQTENRVILQAETN